MVIEKAPTNKQKVTNRQLIILVLYLIPLAIISTYAKKYPDLCQLTEDDEQGGLRFEIDKHRIGIRLTAPYSEERMAAASQRGKESGVRPRRSGKEAK